jgi:ADP-ribose pyrophosphatase YjhB (NUDIX family)
MWFNGAVSSKNAHCSYCGAAFLTGQPWPRTCGRCGNTSFVNPLPVAVCLLPVGDDGLLLVRRGIEPHRGKLALPGGFIDVGESWQQAAARELVEETGVHTDARAIRDFRVLSAPDGTLLVFGLAEPVEASAVPATPPGDETAELVVVSAPQPLAFPLHTQVVDEYFVQR